MKSQRILVFCDNCVMIVSNQEIKRGKKMSDCELYHSEDHLEKIFSNYQLDYVGMTKNEFSRSDVPYILFGAIKEPKKLLEIIEKTSAILDTNNNLCVPHLLKAVALLSQKEDSKYIEALQHLNEAYLLCLDIENYEDSCHWGEILYFSAFVNWKLKHYKKAFKDINKLEKAVLPKHVSNDEFLIAQAKISFDLAKSSESSEISFALNNVSDETIKLLELAISNNLKILGDRLDLDKLCELLQVFIDLEYCGIFQKKLTQEQEELATQLLNSLYYVGPNTDG